MKKVLSIAFVFLAISLNAQKIGLVLSGGGASGLAHIGVLKAIDEQKIPIANISGTSMGALIGAMYSVGYSAKEIEKLFTSSEFQKLIAGETVLHKTHYLKQEEDKPDFITWSFNPKYSLEQNLPKYLVNSNGMEKQLIDLFLSPEMAINNFNDLPIPFLCTASLIEDKSSKIFKQGSLIQAIRASLSYPFYFPAFSIQDTVYFDGGLYNNFPIQASADNFKNDFYIGSNVSYNYNQPEENDIVEQLKNMLVAKTDYSLLGNKGLLIEPNTTSGTFDFSNPQAAIDSGYNMAMTLLKDLPRDTLIFNEAQDKIALFKQKTLRLHNKKYTNTGRFLKAKKSEDVYLDDVAALLNEFHADPFLDRYYAYSEDSSIVFEKRFEDPFELQLGGNVSSKPISTGFAQIKYKNVSQVPTALHANIYFGKFYSSAQAGAKFYFYGNKRPYKLSFDYTLNRWDYFNSKTTFFQESKPPFVVISEDFLAVELSRSFSKSGILSFAVKGGKQNAEYYLDDNFSGSDTADVSRWQGLIPQASMDLNTQNDLIYPTKGARFKILGEYLNGRESYTPGSTALINNQSQNTLDWLRINIQASKFYTIDKRGFFGLGACATLSSDYTFSNFRATQLFSAKFQPVQEMLSFYSDDFQATRFIAPMISAGISPNNNWQIRNDLYFFQNINPIEQGMNQENKIGPILPKGQPVNSLTVFYKTPFGRASVSLNYFSGLPNPFSFIFNFGDIIFNKNFIN